MESVVAREQMSEEYYRLSSYVEVSESWTPHTSHPPSYDEVILNPLQLEGNEVGPHGIFSHAPPSYETADWNERNGVYYVNLPAEDSPEANSHSFVDENQTCVAHQDQRSKGNDNLPAYDEVILNPLQLEGSEVRPHENPHAPPSSETATRNKLKDINIVNNLPKTDWTTWSANKTVRPKFSKRKPVNRPESSFMPSAVNQIGRCGRAEPNKNPTQRFIIPVHPYYLIPPSTSMYQTGSPLHIPRVRRS